MAQNNINIDYKLLKFKARRGMLELDLVLNKYLDNYYYKLKDSEDLKQQFIKLLELSDPELLDLLVNKNINNKYYNNYVNIISDI